MHFTKGLAPLQNEYYRLSPAWTRTSTARLASTPRATSSSFSRPRWYGCSHKCKVALQNLVQKSCSIRLIDGCFGLPIGFVLNKRVPL